MDVTNLFFENLYSSRKSNYIHKFGYCDDVDTGLIDTIWTLGGEYTFTTVPQPYYISSSSVNDTQLIEGELILLNSTGQYVRYIYNVQLNGQNPVQIPTLNNWDVVASNRAYNKTDNTLEGQVFIFENDTLSGGVPQNITKIRSHIRINREQTEQAVYTLPEIDSNGQLIAFGELYSWSASAVRNRDTSGVLDLLVQNRNFVPRVQSTRALSSNFMSSQIYGENTPLIVEPGADIYINVSDVSTNNVEIEAEFTLKLVDL